jgi:flotillin
MLWLAVIAILGVLIFATFGAAMSRYKRCPADKILVIFGKVGAGKAAKCIHGGAAFVWPLIQNYQYLHLTPMTIDIKLMSALSKQNIRVNVPSRFTIGISTEPAIMAAAAERLLSLHRQEIEENARDIIFGQLRATLATMDIEEINADREKFEKKVMDNVETELKKLGLKLINVNITDINDESGYIEALGKKAAAEAINRALVEVAQQERDGESGKATADQERRINVADADAKAVDGENTARVDIANSDANRREQQAEAQRKGEAAEKIKTAEALEAGYEAQQKAEVARAERERATKEADEIVPAEIAKRKKIIEAEAQKQQEILQGQAKGEATMAEMQGEATGMQSILEKQAEGFRQLVSAANGQPEMAVQFLIANRLSELMDIQVGAIKNVKFDKVTVWDSGANSDGKTATADWLSGLMKVVPPLGELFNMSGMSLPDWMGHPTAEATAEPAKTTPQPPEAAPEGEVMP